jgi:hypothetical protein
MASFQTVKHGARWSTFRNLSAAHGRAALRTDSCRDRVVYNSRRTGWCGREHVNVARESGMGEGRWDHDVSRTLRRLVARSIAVGEFETAAVTWKHEGSPTVDEK